MAKPYIIPSFNEAAHRVCILLMKPPSANEGIPVRAVAQASKLRAAASFFSRYLSLIWKIIFRCAEISGIYRVELIFGYTKKGVVFVKRFLRGFQLKERFPEPSVCDP